MSNLGVKVVQKVIDGETLHIKTLTGGANAAAIIEMLGQVSAKPGLLPELGSLLVVECLCDSSGKRLYTDPVFVRENASVGFLSDFTSAALEVSGLADTATEKNLPADQ